MYDMQGKQVRNISAEKNETEIDISVLPEGVYGIKVIGGSVMMFVKVMIVK